MNAPHAGQLGSRAVADFILLNEEIAALVRARLPLESNLADLARELPKRSGSLAEEIRRRLEVGQSLTDAIDGACASLPAAYRATILAGVESGDLAGALESLAECASRFEQLRRVAGFAVLYPLVLFLTICLALALVVGVVMPSFGWLNDPHFGPLAALAGSRELTIAIAIALPAIVLCLAGGWWWRSGRLGASSFRGLGWFRWLPWVRRVNYWAQAAAFSDLLRMLVARGVPIDRALPLAAEGTSDTRLITAARELGERLHSGNQLRPADRAALVALGMPPLVQSALRQIDDRRQLIGGLRQAAQMYHERAVIWSESFAETFPMLMTLVVGGSMTFAFAVLVFWPYVSMLYELAAWNWR
jgi:general secretion pathway protein F